MNVALEVLQSFIEHPNTIPTTKDRVCVLAKVFSAILSYFSKKPWKYLQQSLTVHLNTVQYNCHEMGWGVVLKFN